MSDFNAVIANTCVNVWHKFEGKGSLRFLEKSSRTVFAGIVLRDDSETPPKFHCISIGSGTKCLPQSRLTEEGDALHDSHAEVLARRGAVRWLIEEWSRLSDQSPSGSLTKWLIRAPSGLVALKDSVSMHLYVSSIPCGDASMLALALDQDPTVAALKDSGSRSDVQEGTAVRGRDNYFAFGALRTKPGRADSMPSISMSCSDKILKWALLGIQGAVASLRFQPMYLSSIIISGVPVGNRNTAVGECERAFSPYRRLQRRMFAPSTVLRVSDSSSAFDSAWKFEPFAYHRVEIGFTDVEFPASRGDRFCNESIAWNAHGQLEILVNGRTQGSLGASKRRKLPTLSRAAIRSLLGEYNWVITREGMRYNATKQSSSAYQAARAQLMASGGPLEGWIVTQEDRKI
ncbi:uncharacterized protein EI90DRAFT_3292150 [Cantharellus anzutake]|uniref:uncharacterized protein n=1 Tax=Cantharellus anzutake TaxID=1750568 RepID=UPI0019085154|nr:uncharacterized protein EI90DRAFT_3292150 [Cantharellus anzutake]KAF8324469.1 hypothetical protein EI90DRAFT_3292150 [Cantharellus anzutake]